MTSVPRASASSRPLPRSSRETGAISPSVCWTKIMTPLQLCFPFRTPPSQDELFLEPLGDPARRVPGVQLDHGSFPLTALVKDFMTRVGEP